MTTASPTSVQQIGLYTPDQRVRRDNSVWTLVQGILAPTPFLVFLISLCLVIRYIMTGDGSVVTTDPSMAETGSLDLSHLRGARWDQ